MSRNLPSQPNLEHLRKQAKDFLRDAQQRDPAFKLADAQHAIAREYGFASWPKLKAHVASLTPHTPSPFAGTWTANLARSTPHPSNPFQRATIEFDVAGDTVTITDSFVDAAGRHSQSEHTVRADGQPYPTGNGYALTATWRGTHILETVATRDGSVVGQGRYEVSADGRTLTVSGADQEIVLERHTT